MEDIIKNLFYDNLSVSNLKNILPNVKQEDIDNVLKNQEVYQLMKRQTKTKHNYPLSANYENQRVQIDLLDIGSSFNKYPKQKNKGYRYIFCCVDVFTRKAYTYPLKTKNKDEIVKAFEEILNDLGEPPFQLDCDNEGAFKSRLFKNVCKKYKININYVQSGDVQAKGVVERFNQTLRRMIVLLTLIRGQRVWYDKLQDITNIYNNSFNTGIHQTPNKINIEERMKDIELKKEKAKLPYINVGDKVRLLKQKNLGDKKTDRRWSKTTYIVKEVRGNNVFVENRKRYYKRDEVQVINKIENIPEEIKDEFEVPVRDNRRDKDLQNERRQEIMLNRAGVNKDNIQEGRRQRRRNRRYENDFV